MEKQLERINEVMSLNYKLSAQTKAYALWARAEVCLIRKFFGLAFFIFFLLLILRNTSIIQKKGFY